MNLTPNELYLKAIDIGLSTLYQKVGINQVKDEEAVEAIETVYRHLKKAHTVRTNKDKDAKRA